MAIIKTTVGTLKNVIREALAPVQRFRLVLELADDTRRGIDNVIRSWNMSQRLKANRIGFRTMPQSMNGVTCEYNLVGPEQALMQILAKEHEL